MKGKHFVIGGYSILLLFILGIIYSCRDELLGTWGSDESEVFSTDVIRAKGVFDGLSPDYPCVQARSSGDVVKSVIMEPNWKDAFRGENKDSRSIETNILLSKPFHVVSKESYVAYEKTKDARYLNYLSRAVVLTEKLSEVSDAFIMTIVGSKEYMEKHNFQLWEVSYFNIPKDFSGMILYYSLDGNFVNGWYVEENNQIKTCQPVSKEDVALFARSDSGCYTVEVTHTYIDCITYSGNTFTTYEGESFSFDWSETVCGSPYTYTFSYTVCNSSPSSSSGGYSPSSNSNIKKYFRYFPQEVSGDLERFIRYMRDKDCVSRSILDQAENLMGFEPVNLAIDPVMAPNVAKYDPEKNTIYFHDKSDVLEKTMYEEFIHILQSKLYTTDEINRGAFNMEFEAKLLIDYIGISRGGMSETDLQEIAYLENDMLPPLDHYLEERVNLINNRFNSNDFLTYMHLWKGITVAYKDFNKDSSIEPKLIKGIVNNLDLSCFN